VNGRPFRWSDDEVRAALGCAPTTPPPVEAFTGVSTDTRAIRPGALFVALAGTRFDAHDFLAQAVEAGAAGLVVSRAVDVPDHVAVYSVPDTLVALGDLARHRRRALKARVVGITGSAGKTTTKELLRAALAQEFRVHANPGNLNNRIGLPLTLLETPEDAEVVVLELGTNEPGEIATLTAIAEPDVGVISLVAQAHLEKLGTLEGVYREKLALLRGLGEDGTAVVGDQPFALIQRARDIVPGCRVAGWSPSADDDLTPQAVSSDAAGRFSFQWEGVTVALQIPGRHAVLAALLALGVATAMGVSPAAAAAGVGSVKPVALRGEVRRVGPVTLIVDCYNASPRSVSAGMDLLSDLPARTRRVAILGSMLEMGAREIEIHQETLLEALTRPVDLVVVSGLFAAAARQLRMDGADFEGSERVLGVAMERLIPLFEEAFGGSDRTGSRGSGGSGSLDAPRAGAA